MPKSRSGILLYDYSRMIYDFEQNLISLELWFNVTIFLLPAVSVINCNVVSASFFYLTAYEV